MKSTELAKTIHEKIVNYILASPLNITFIPDDIERKMYECVVNTISRNIQTEDLTRLIHTNIVDFILASPLNISIIPDDIEREMYEYILNIVSSSINLEKSCMSCRCL